MNNCGDIGFAIIKGRSGCPLGTRMCNTKSEFKKKIVLNEIFTVDHD